MNEFKARVAAGAAWLDAVSPGWFNEIDWDTFDIQERCGCVLGQLVGSYDKCDATPFDFNNEKDSDEVLEMVRFKQEELVSEGFNPQLVLTHAQSCAFGFHGFNVGTGENRELCNAEWKGLQKAWKQIILDRRAASIAAGV